jgi:3-oxoadipate enol-lactonase
VAAPTILLLHAFPLDARMWAAQRRALEEEGYKVSAPDLPGEPPIVGFDSWARRVLGLVSGPIVPIGCSMGGYLAFELWRQAPEQIAGLGLIDTRATPDTPEQRQVRDDTIRLLGEEGFDPFWERSAPNLFAREDPGARPIAAEQPITGLVASLETLRDRPDSREALPTIDVPVLVVVGEQDRLTPPEDSEAMVAALPDARFLRVRGAGHLTPLERPDEVTEALLAFVREVAS